MKRRKFIKDTMVGSTGLIIFPSFMKTVSSNDEIISSGLEENFIKPPPSARPWVFWQWMNGNITKQGITLDLEAMERMGIGGAICFNNAVGIPRGPVDYASETWIEATAHAAKEAERLGITLTVHNSPGYSGCGGPWITPEMSMQQLVWEETFIVAGVGPVNLLLSKPYSKKDYYKDALVLAYPSITAEQILMKDALTRVTVNGKEIDKNVLTDGNVDNKIRLEISGEEAVLQFDFSTPFEARALAILRKPEIPMDLFDGPRDHPPVFRLEYSQNGTDFKLIGMVRCPELREMDTPAVLSFAAVMGVSYRLVSSTVSWVCNVELHNGPRLAGWPGKANYTHGDSGGETPEVENDNIINPAKVIDISDMMDANGRLQWNAPVGRWTILRIGHTTTGEECAAQPDSGKGLEIDKFNKKALDFHFNHFLNKLIARLKPYKSFKGITVDSWEAGKQNWTIDFPELFFKINHYKILQWMPAVTGRIVGSINETERFLWDFRKTQANLLSENFYGYFKSLCAEKELEFYAEPYGDGNLDSLQIAQYPDITMSEFWTRYIYGSDIYSKQAVSAAHIYGKKIVAAESFTAMPATSKWTDYPYSLKAEGDYFFTLGVNRLVFHVFVHQPYTTGKPGMTMGPFGMHIDRNNTWTEQAHGWTGYIQRTQYLLQQGFTVSDICYFKGDNPESGVPDIYRFLPEGYAGDVIGTDALTKRIAIRDRKIVLPDGMQYKVLVMAPLQQILPTTLARIKELVEQGMHLIVSSKPSKAYGYAALDSEVHSIALELYGNLDGNTYKERKLGKGKVSWTRNWEQVLTDSNIFPDFTYTAENSDAAVHYIHKQLGSADFYFISNHKRKKESIVCSFRISGKQPEVWNPETGMICEAVLYEIADGRTQMPLELQPAGSLFIIFRIKISAGYSTLTKDGKIISSTKQFSRSPLELYGNVQDDFTISVWIKPDTFAHPGRSMIFHPADGETLYGKGHVTIGISAGQNAIRIFEKRLGQTHEVLGYETSIAGWTHIAVVYKKGAPILYINGKSVSKGRASGKTIHPGLGTPSSRDQFSTYFEGNYTTPKLIRYSLSEREVNDIFIDGLPAPTLPEGIEIFRHKNQIKSLAWQNGKYELKNRTQSRLISNADECKVIEMKGEWKISFSADTGIPEIILPSLISLHKHENGSVRYFSGTCTYIKNFSVVSTDLKPGHRIFIHLGRVEVIAELKVNGIKTALLWKEPFLADITSSLKPGANVLEIEVTNLWPNRLIGDEQLSEENEYSEHHFVKQLPEWYVQNRPNPGKRKSFAVWKVYDRNGPLLESGLLGPVKLITGIETTINL